MQTRSVQIVEDTRLALQSVRGGLIDLYGALGANPTAPQDVARLCDLNRNLTWKLSRVINAPEPFSSLNHLPSEQGLEIAIDAFENAGAPPDAVANIRSAVRRFADVVQAHAGDRETLELILESMGLFERGTTTDSSRELAFRGNSGIWGVQARTRVTTAFVAPSPSDHSKHDCVVVSGLVGFRRLRPSAQWPLLRQTHTTDKGASLEAQLEELEPHSSGQTPLILYEFCSPNMPALSIVDGPEGRDVMLPGGEVGNQAAFDCFYGYRFRGISALRRQGDEYGAFAAPITLPAERLIFDLIFHKSLAIDQTAQALLYGFPHGGPDDPSTQTERNQLRLSERPMELAGSPPAVATPLAPPIARIAERVYARMDWNPSDFRGLRLHVPHPPMSSRVVIRWPLAAATT
jgi:hypothetical protein